MLGQLRNVGVLESSKMEFGQKSEVSEKGGGGDQRQVRDYESDI